MPGGFDRLAPYYDFLARIVFGDEILRSQLHFLQDVKIKTTVLIVGGGSGSILPVLLTNPHLTIDFLDQSAAMLKKAKGRVESSEAVTFIQQDFFDYQPDKTYDLILVPFFLDMFLDTTLQNVAEKIDRLSSPSTILVVTDFIRQPDAGTLKAATMKVMYYFFRFTCGIEASDLPDWQAIFAKHWRLRQTAIFFHGMIGAYLLNRRQ